MTQLAQTTQPSTPGPLDPSTPSLRWLELDEAAALSGKSDRHLRRLAGERWLSDGLARLIQEPGTKARWQIRSDAEPALAMRGPQASVIVPVPDLRRHAAPVRDKALQKAAILERWRKTVSALTAVGMTKDEATDRFMSTLDKEAKDRDPTNPEARGPSRPTLYLWAKQCRDAGGAEALVDGRSVKEDALATSADFFSELRRLWETKRKRKVIVCYEMALDKAQQMGWHIPSYRVSRRFIQKIKADEAAAVAWRRESEQKFTDLHTPSLKGDYSPLETNEFWDADHHLMDVLVKVGEKINPNTGEVVSQFARPWLTAWQDMRSRKIVGWRIRLEDPNTDVIMETLGIAIRTHGVPENAYTDNGKDFDCQYLTGLTKKQRWKLRRLHVAHDQTKLGGVYAALQINHIHCWPWHGQSKPIERFFGTLEDRFGRTVDTYCGRKPEERPDDLDDMLAAGKAPTLEEFTAAFAQWLEVGYHQKIHTGQAMDERPAVVFEQHLHTKRTASETVLEILLQPRVGPVTVTKDGVCWKGLQYGQFTDLTRETEPAKITDEQCQQVIEGVKAYLKKNGITQSTLAKSLILASSTVSQVLSGSYAADHRAVVQAMDRWLERRKNADALPQISKFIWTDVARQIRLAAQRSIQAADMGIDTRISLVWGDPGCGKTLALEAIAQSEDGLLITCGIDLQSGNSILDKLSQMLGLGIYTTGAKKFAAVVDRLRGSGKLIIVDEIHALLDCRDDSAFHTLRRLSDQTGCPQLWAATCNLIEELRTRERRREPLGQIISRIGSQFHLTAKLKGTGPNGGRPEPLISVEQVLEIYGCNELKLTKDAARFLARFCTNPRIGLLRGCTGLVATATAMNRGKSNQLTSEMLWEACLFLFQNTILMSVQATLKEELQEMKLKIA